MLSFSAFNDPLTGTKLTLDAGARARLNAPEAAKFASPRLALDPTAPPDVAEQAKALVRFHKGMLGEGR